MRSVRGGYFNGPEEAHMATLMIGYDLNKTKDYPALFQAIKGLGGAWWHHLDSTWLVKLNDCD